MEQNNQSAQSLILAKKFSLGEIVKTPAVASLLSPSEVNHYLQRYIRGDWGNTVTGDQQINDLAVINGESILAIYDTPKGKTICILTEYDRSLTTIFLSGEN